jgi:hypothetical protein
MDLQELVGAVAAVANVEPNLAQETLAEEENDANAAVFLSLKKRQEEAKLVAVQGGRQGKAQHNPAIPAVLELWVVSPSLTLSGSGSGSSSSSSSSSRARSTTTRRRSARELPATRRSRNPRAIPWARVPGGALEGGQCTYR